jgi:hypothetical protein
VEQERRGDLEDQIYTTQKLLNGINVDVRVERKPLTARAAMEHTYASFRFSERRSNRHVGLAPTAVLSFVIMIVVVLQKERVNGLCHDDVRPSHSPGVSVATVMRALTRPACERTGTKSISAAG